MKSDLDSVPWHRWLVEDVSFESDELLVLVAEGLVSKEPSELHVGGTTLTDLHEVAPGDTSRRFIVRFPDVTFLQVFDENFQKDDDYEHRDDGVVGCYSRSRLLDYAAEHTYLFDMLPGKIRHYDLQTGDDCFHVLGREPPEVEPAEDTNE